MRSGPARDRSPPTGFSGGLPVGPPRRPTKENSMTRPKQTSNSNTNTDPFAHLTDEALRTTTEMAAEVEQSLRTDNPPLGIKERARLARLWRGADKIAPLVVKLADDFGLEVNTMAAAQILGLLGV